MTTAEALDLEYYHVTNNREDLFYFLDCADFKDLIMGTSELPNVYHARAGNGQYLKIRLGDFIIRDENNQYHIICAEAFKEWASCITNQMKG